MQPPTVPAGVTTSALTGVAGASLLYLLIGVLATTIRIRRPRRPRSSGRTLSLLGLALAATAPAVAEERGSASPHRSRSLSPAPPWSEPDGYPPHPSGRTGARDAVRAFADPPPAATRRVRPGDSLWSISGEYMGTDDAARIARYWPRVYRTNRSMVGADPNLVHPGQILTMPSESGTGSSHR